MARAFTLPSGRVVSLEPRPGIGRRTRAKGAPLFAEAVALFREGDVALRERQALVDVGGFELRDFHTLRAIATRLGWLAEEPVHLTCRNCGEALTIAPCEALPLGPFQDGELHDPELDSTLDLTIPHAIPDVPFGRGGVARTVTLARRTVDEAAPLHRALRRRRLTISPPLVRAMGIAALGAERDPARVADALAACSDDAWGTITDLFLEAHYPLRLFSIAVCPHCKARNDVDAPYEREFEPTGSLRVNGDSPPEHSVLSAETKEDSPPSFEQFDAVAHAIAEEVLGDSPIVLVVDGGVPACDDGGEPLLGSYVPPFEGDMTNPSRAPEITVYFRTFQALWREEGPYDWRAELRETLEHELEHHHFHLVGEDPMDEAERDAIGQEVVRVLGKKAVVRAEITGLAADFSGFMRRTWPIWLLLLAAIAAVTIGTR